MKINYSHLQTEQRNPRSKHIDRLSSRAIATLMVNEEAFVTQALRKAIPDLAQVIDHIVASFRKNGRLIFVGAGTSGRLGVLEAAECPPTFNSSKNQVIGIMAGGKQAVFRSQEGAEDHVGNGKSAIQKVVRAGDVVVGVAASGVTPFVGAALQEAKRQKAFTVLITCNRKIPRFPFIQKTIYLIAGPEVVTGSTRLKSGTVCKLALNILTTGSFVRIGKVYENRMVDLQPRSRKLVARGVGLIADLGGVSEKEAEKLLQSARGRVKVAIVMARKTCSYMQAKALLARHKDSLRQVIDR